MQSGQFQLDPQRLQRVRETAIAEVDKRQFNSVEWTITLDRQTIDSGIYGYADIGSNTPLPERPIYRIYSMTKPIVSIATLRLIESGDIKLTAPIETWLPAFANKKILNGGKTRAANGPITVEHLLTHRSGLSYDFMPDCEVAERYRTNAFMNRADLSLEEFVDALAQEHIAYEPGTVWHYSYSTDVLARILELASGQSLTEVLRKLIFDPCAMHETGFRLTDSMQKRLLPAFGQQGLQDARAPIPGPHKLKPMDVDIGHPQNSEKFARGGHGLYATTEDYLKFMHVLYDGCTADGEALLSAPMVDMMWRDRIPPHQQPLVISGESLGGYGWNLFGRVMNDTGQAAFLTAPGEGGWSGAAATYFWVDRNTKLGGLVMTQYMGATVPLGDMIRSAAYQSLLYT